MEAVTILLADDEALLLMDFEVALAHAGFHVTAVTRGGKAIEILRVANAPIDGVVTDIRFGEYPDGWEVARVAREIDPDIPVVYISGHGAVDWASKGVPNSIMIEKPFTSSQLLTGLSGILCGGPVSSVEEPLAKDDGELCLCLDPFPRRPFPLLGRVVKNEI
ncbi:response regulator [Sinorhizobium meliloti]|uniref:response regulator n=1 Tax=Rhizobium meliloti TaxID=382 RepID=UPI001F174295|nr:response regulator [Sinorhizobium meliloti]